MYKVVKVVLMAGIVMTGAHSAQAQFGDVLNKAKKAMNDAGVNTGGRGGSYTNTEAVSALREALKIGTQNASGRLSTVNGFFGNQLIKVLMPPEAKKVENTLRSIGMGDQVDKAILSMNRAAEDASGKAVQIFVNAITSMSVSDGIAIVRGGQGAATNYLKNRTTGELTNAFRPIVNNSLNKVNATKYWGDVFTVYNALPTTRQKVNTDLVAYVTERALNGLFVTIADEENKIRTNPAARITDILKKVFGAV
ncbi:DUF4197 domain-containing protein [Polluticoccus soli]|uniref:DUF4197 domain-containing protein n=1 Tax=Polluticoccus soli TaxID=3034150 RepID=UPI0023E10C8B|nr:DUF4197 domain-containing protein [Flavipsychrobacter sp. JY13-12]